MYCALKLPRDIRCNADIPKLVFGYWPKFNEDFVTKNTDCNISITIRNKHDSLGNIHGVILLFQKGHFSNVPHISSISKTLLDESNPLSTSFTGEYAKAQNSYTLAYYDGVENVYVDCFTKFQLKRENLFDFLEVHFSKPIRPGECLAFRFTYCSETLFRQDRNGSWHFAQDYLCMGNISKFDRKYITNNVLSKHHEIPILTNYDQHSNGGFDIFYYIAEELKGDEFDSSPTAKLSLNYDYIGSRTEYTLKKHSWPAHRLLGIDSGNPCELTLGSGIRIGGHFYNPKPRRDIIMVDIDRVVIADRGGIAVGGDTKNSHLSTSSRESNDNSQLFFEKIDSIINELEEALKSNYTLASENRVMLTQLIEMLKTQAPTKNKALLKNTLEGLIEVLKLAGDIAPGISNITDFIKHYF